MELFRDLRGAVVCGVVAGFVLICTVLATGSTFGQRCAAEHEKDSAAWQACVLALKAGGDAGLAR